MGVRRFGADHELPRPRKMDPRVVKHRPDGGQLRRLFITNGCGNPARG